MKCACGADTKVVDTRLVEGRQRRRRVCMDCGKRFNTYEVHEHELPEKEVEEKPKEPRPLKKTIYVSKETAQQIKEKRRKARHMIEDMRHWEKIAEDDLFWSGDPQDD